MQVEQVLERKSILVGKRSSDAPYIYVDWGEDVRRQHDAALPQYAHAGGRGYFRTRVVQKYLQEGTLERIPESPEFSYPI